eukprot:GFUD01035382.1.p1 GENE.GFUD01035382.1~~GFUD01035382.1.p1  ORF type:complete len:197 (+),score=85.51 GFUD01035382.1:81-671(+)
MSDTDSVRGDSSEEEVEDMEEEVEDIEEEEIVLIDGGQTMMKNGGGTVVTVITRNVKEVSWPPTEFQAKEKEEINSIKTLPNLSGIVHLGKGRRQKMDLELQNFQGSTAHYSSNPFSKGGFQPNKMKAEERWKPKQPTPETSRETERHRLVLRDTDTVLTQGPVGGHSSYKIPPGTTRTKKFQKENAKETVTMEDD